MDDEDEGGCNLTAEDNEAGDVEQRLDIIIEKLCYLQPLAVAASESLKVGFSPMLALPQIPLWPPALPLV